MICKRLVGGGVSFDFPFARGRTAAGRNDGKMQRKRRSGEQRIGMRKALEAAQRQ